MRTRTKIAAIASVLMMPLLGNIPADATPQTEAPTDSDTTVAEGRYARVPFNPSDEGTDTSTPQIQTRSAEGISWAPGSAGAYNELYVKGQGTYVSTARIAYFAGLPVVNACSEKFEIAYYENGRRKVETHGGHCGLGRITSVFQINRNLDNNKPFCGRAKANGQWGNYACIQIKR